MDNALQIQNVAGNNMSLSKVLLVFYLIIATNFTNNLVSKQLKEFIEDSRIAQHIIALVTMLVLITSIGGVVDTKKAVFYSIFGYVWFLFTTKLDIHWNMVIIMILVAGYLYENSISEHEQELSDDKNVDKKKKEEIIRNDNNIKSGIVYAAILVTVIGTLMYNTKKQVQYGGGFDPVTYLLY